MPTSRLSIPQWQTWVKKYGKRVVAAGQRGLISGGLRGVTILQKATRDAMPANPDGIGSGGAFNTGDFLRGWKMTVADKRVLLYNSSPYAAIIEAGRKPGSKPPPRRVIEQWARRRLGMTADEAHAAAFAFAAEIGRRGLRGRWIMRDSMKAINKAIVEEINREVAAEIQR